MITGLLRFILNGFKPCLTLFSKFFASFPRGTCTLSVSRIYLALDEVYHPLRAAFPSNPTLCNITVPHHYPGHGRGYHPL